MAISSSYSVEGAKLSSAMHQSKLVTSFASTWHYTNNLEPTPYLDQVDLVLSTQGFNQLDVHRLVAVGRKGAKVSLAPAIGKKRGPCLTTHRHRKSPLVGNQMLHLREKNWVTMAGFLI